MKILVLGDFHGKFPEKIKMAVRKEKVDLIIGVGDYSGIEEWYKYIRMIFKIPKGRRDEMPAPEEFYGDKKFKKLLREDFKAGKYVLNELNKLGKGIIIFGNADDGWYNYPFDIKSLKAENKKRRFISNLKNIRDITYSSTKFNGIKIAGFGGYMDVSANWSKKDKKYKKMIERAKKSRKKLIKIMKEHPEIMVLHYPPKGVFDIIKDKRNHYHGKGIGISAFREAILKYKPQLVFCGHMHEYQGVKKIGQTRVINPGEAGRGKYAIVDFDEKRGRVGKIRIVK